MGYELYMGNILCPVTPSKIQLKIKNQNKTMNLVNGAEINVLKGAGLTEISYDLLLPNVSYKFAQYKSGFVNAQYFLNEFEKLKVEKKPFVFKLLRTFPNGVDLYNTDDMLVSLESYTIKEDANQGFDVIVSINLKQYKPYGTKIVKVLNSSGTASIENVRETSNSPAPSDNPVTTYTVVEGDCLWNIAKAYYGNGAKYPAIIEANKDKITNSGMIYPGQILIIPGAETAAKVTQTSKKTTSSTTTQYVPAAVKVAVSDAISVTSVVSEVKAFLPDFVKSFVTVGISNGTTPIYCYQTANQCFTKGTTVTLHLKFKTSGTMQHFKGWNINGINKIDSVGKSEYTFTLTENNYICLANFDGLDVGRT